MKCMRDRRRPAGGSSRQAAIGEGRNNLAKSTTKAPVTSKRQPAKTTCETGKHRKAATCQERQKDGVFRRCGSSAEGRRSCQARSKADRNESSACCRESASIRRKTRRRRKAVASAKPAAGKASGQAGADSGCERPSKPSASRQSPQREACQPRFAGKTSAKPWLKSYPKDVPAEIAPLTVGSIGDLLVDACKQYAGRPAFTCMGKTITYARTRAAVGRLRRLSAVEGPRQGRARRAS